MRKRLICSNTLICIERWRVILSTQPLDEMSKWYPGSPCLLPLCAPTNLCKGCFPLDHIKAIKITLLLGFLYSVSLIKSQWTGPERMLRTHGSDVTWLKYPKWAPKRRGQLHRQALTGSISYIILEPISWSRFRKVTSQSGLGSINDTMLLVSWSHTRQPHLEGNDYSLWHGRGCS